jgi:hypothetical protein
MPGTEATADSFITLLKALPKAQRDAIVVRIARDEEFAHDILDLATIAERRKEESRPFREYLAEKRAR